MIQRVHSSRTTSDKDLSIMAATGNTRAKRKNVSNEVKSEPAKKALKKNDLLLQYQTLQKRFANLEEEHKNLVQEKKDHIEAILMLEETVNPIWTGV